jgi:AraC-like DNA-binding protein
MVWVKTYAFSDPFSYQVAIQAANVEFLPTDRGRFQSELTQIRMNKIWMQRYHATLPQIHLVANHPGRTVFGFPTEPTSAPLEHRGMEVMPGEFALSGVGAFHQRAPANLYHGTISLADEDMRTMHKILIGRAPTEARLKPVIRPDPGVASRLLNLHRVLGQLALDTPELFNLTELVRALEQQATHLMIRCLADGSSRDFTPGGRHHNAIMTKFEDYLAAHPDRPLYLTDICAGIGVAERTLRAACEEHLGMGPIRYLTLRRMYLARRALLGAEASETNVTRIVTDHGFWELGRFSVAYRTIFGESPSETLRRPAEQAAISLNRPLSLPPNVAARHSA